MTTRSPFVTPSRVSPPAHCAALSRSLPVRKLFHRFCDRAVVNQCDLFSPAILHVPVQCIITAVEDAATKPACKRRVVVIKDLVPLAVPMHRFSLPAPRILQGAQLNVCRLHHIPIIPAPAMLVPNIHHRSKNLLIQYRERGVIIVLSSAPRREMAAAQVVSRNEVKRA